MRCFYQAVLQYLLQKLPLRNKILKSCSALRRDSIRKVSSVKDIKILIESLCPSAADGISNDWRLLMMDPVLDVQFTDDDTSLRKDNFWNQIFQLEDVNGDLKYPHLTKTVKIALVLAHGNSDVERSFSESGNCVTSQRSSFSVDSINAIRTTVDGHSRSIQRTI